MSILTEAIRAAAHPELSIAQIAKLLGCDRGTVHRIVKEFGLPAKTRTPPAARVDPVRDQVLAMADGVRTSAEIAQQVGCSAKRVQSIVKLHGAPRLAQGARQGEANSSWAGGRIVDLDGYVLVLAPEGHPGAREDGRIYEHRLVAEQGLGRPLLPSETVDHIDGLHLHNAPLNLRVFASNAEHLRATISGQRPQWSPAGWLNMTTNRHRASLAPVDSYRQRKASGVVRLLQILRAALRLGTDSPHLSGTLHHLTQAQIDYSSPTTIERALADLSTK